MSRKIRRTRKEGPSPQIPWLWLVSGGAILLIVAGLLIWQSSASAPATGTSDGAGAPKLVVDRTTLDDGYVKFETPIQAAFKLSNAGSQPLQILDEPQVKLIEGC